MTTLESYRDWLLPLAIVFLGWSVGCDSSEMAGQAGSDSIEDPPNVILISLDSLRADHLGVYRYDRETSPAINQLASDATVFERAVAPTPWTLPTHVSLLTSQYAHTHQVDRLNRSLPRNTLTLTSALKSADYSTHAIVSGPLLQARYGMDNGFDAYDDTLARGSNRASHSKVTGEAMVTQVSRFLGSAEPPFFLFAHYWDAHYDYNPPDRYARRFDPEYSGKVSPVDFIRNKAINKNMERRDLDHLIALYDAEITWVDTQVGKLVAALKQSGHYENSIIILTADHGDEFFEHGEKGHQHSLYEELLHVPLIMKFPDVEGGGRIPSRVSLIDVMPTVLDALGLDIPHGTQGRSVWPLLRGESQPERTIFAETNRTRKDIGDPVQSKSWAVYEGRFKLIVFAKDRYPPELYDLDADPGETHNLVGTVDHEPYLRRLQDWLRSTPVHAPGHEIELDEETANELESLGYIDSDGER